MYVKLLTNIMKNVNCCLSTRNIFKLILKWHQQRMTIYCLPVQTIFICSMSISVQPLMCYCLQTFDIDCELWCAAVKQSKISFHRGDRYTCTNNAELFTTNPCGCGIWTSVMSQNHPLHTCCCARRWQPFSVHLCSRLLWESHIGPVVCLVLEFHIKMT